MVFKKEFEMREPVKNWLIEREFYPAVEFWLHNAGITDIVAGFYGKRNGRKIPDLIETTSIELKLNDVAGVLRQAIQNKHKCDWSYAAFPNSRIEKMRQQTIDQFMVAGVGLLSVGFDVVEVVCPSQGPGLPSESREAKQLWRRVRSLVGVTA